MSKRTKQQHKTAELRTSRVFRSRAAQGRMNVLISTREKRVKSLNDFDVTPVLDKGVFSKIRSFNFDVTPDGTRSFSFREKLHFDDLRQKRRFNPVSIAIKGAMVLFFLALLTPLAVDGLTSSGWLKPASTTSRVLCTVMDRYNLGFGLSKSCSIFSQHIDNNDLPSADEITIEILQGTKS